MNRRIFEALDLFAGGGGFSTGLSLSSAGGSSFEIKRAVEIDENACKTLEVHLGKEKVMLGDITEQVFKERVIKECKDVDVIIGGPPCQTFSLAGPARSGKKDVRKLLRDDPRNTLYKHFFELVEKIRPQIVVFENVEGIISKKADENGLNKNDQVVIEAICEELESLGYNCSLGNGSKYQVLNATDFEVPQQRKRVIIIANKLNQVNPILSLEDNSNTKKTVHDAIAHLPVVLPVINVNGFEKMKNMDIVFERFDESISIFVEHFNYLADYYRGRTEVQSEKFTNLLIYLNEQLELLKGRKTQKSEALRNFINKYNTLVKGLDGNDTIPCSHTEHKSRKHNFRDILIFILMKQGSSSAQFMNKNSEFYDDLLDQLYPYDRTKHVDTYVKHSWTKPSNTILAHMEKDGLKFIHPIQPRSLTPYEAALIQSFPPDYEFHGGRNAQYRQIGNAVPPLMAKNIGNSLLEMLQEAEDKLIHNKIG